MSFSKAKIQRFNEIHSCSPAPSAYNPKVQVNSTGAVIPKSERFVTESPANSVHSGDNASVKSGNGSLFRTPQLNKKKKVLPHSAAKTPTAQLFSSEDGEALREKIVECMNKDESIKDLAFQIEELKDQISHLEIQQHQLNTENQQYEVNLSKEKSKYEFMMSQQQEKHEKEVSNCNETIRNREEELNKILMESNENKKKFNEDVMKLKDNIELLESLKNTLSKEYTKQLETEQQEWAEKIKIVEERYEGSLVALTELQRSHSEEIEQLKSQHVLEVQDIEFEMLKCVTEAQKCINLNNTEIENLKELVQCKDELIADLKKKIELLEKDYEARLKQAEENSVETMKLAEIQMEERCRGIEEDWNLKLKEQQMESEAILKECQAIGEFNIIQCELEKNQIKIELNGVEDRLKQCEEMKVSALKDQESLKKKHTKAVEELHQTREDLEKQLELQEAALNKIKSEKHTYQVSYNTALETVEALKNRLINSDKDVEQLKEELEIVERTKLQQEEECNTMLDELSSAIKLKDELIKRNENIDEYVSEMVSGAEEKLLAKVDQLQEVAKKEIDVLKSTVSEKHELLKSALEQLAKQEKLNKESLQLITTVKLELEQTESENTELNYAKSRLEASVERLHQELSESSEINRKYIEQSGKIDDLQQKYEELSLENRELHKTVALLNDLIGPFKQQLQGYEAERQALEVRNSETQNEIREISLRYSEMLGHQNSKQKLKHLVDLKQKNLDLINKNSEMEIKMKAQTKLIETLKKELSDKIGPKKSAKVSISTPISDKENVSPLKMRNLH